LAGTIDLLDPVRVTVRNLGTSYLGFSILATSLLSFLLEEVGLLEKRFEKKVRKKVLTEKMDFDIKERALAL